MRIKFLSVIVSFLLVSIAISSCLDSDDNYEVSSDATVHAFGLDTVHGRHYQFTIDNLKKLIYNRDSMPVGADTILDKILIDTFTVSGWILAGVNDSVLSISDSVDLSSTINKKFEESMKFKVYAPSGTYSTYTLKINVHLQEPDSLVWKECTPFTDAPVAEQKAIAKGEDVWVYVSNETAYRGSVRSGVVSWSEEALNNLPEDVRLSSMMNFGEKLYVVTESGKTYRSSNALNWEELTALDSDVKAIIPCFDNCIVAIVTIDGKNYFRTSRDGDVWEAEKAEGTVVLNEVPEGFPVSQISVSRFMTANNQSQVMVVGMPQWQDETHTWFSLNGKEWTDLTSTAYDAYCPAMDHPVGIYYGDTFYIFGGTLEDVYSSETGIAWRKTKRLFLLPEAFQEQNAPYSVTIDKEHYIWMVFGGDNAPNKVWRGRLNRLGFIIQ